MENAKTNKKGFLIVDAILFAGYIVLGILLFTVGEHCRADSVIFVIGLVAALVCAALLIVHGKRGSKQ